MERALQLGRQYDLIILDVELGDMSGVQIAELVRNKLRELYTPVLYISAHSNHSIKVHQTRPLNFLVKPIKPSELHDCLLEAMEFYTASKDYFDCVIEKKHQRILSCTIQYFGSKNKRILIYTTSEPLSCYGQDLFDRVQERLAKNKKAPSRHKAEDADYQVILRPLRGLSLRRERHQPHRECPPLLQVCVR